MLQSKVIKQKAYQTLLYIFDSEFTEEYFNSSFQLNTKETKEEIKSIMFEERQRIQNKLDKISLRPKGEITNGSTTISK